MTKDVAEGITQIDWTVYGKIKSITKDNSASIKNSITFGYSPDGHRVSKKVEHKDAMGSVLYSQTTYYVRDASGNIMSTYMLSHDTLRWQTAGIYGSSRLGEYHADKIIDINGTKPTNPLQSDEYAYYRGYKRYELSNHLGNVLAVVSDKRTLICISGDTYYEADIVSAQDYYPFGMLMKERSFFSETYGFGFQGQEKDDELKGAGNAVVFKYRIHDPRIGRFFSTDPLEMYLAWNSPYSFSENNIINYIEFEGKERYRIQPTNSITIKNNYLRTKTTKIKVQSKNDINNENNNKQQQSNRKVTPGVIEKPIIDNAPHEGGQTSRENLKESITNVTFQIKDAYDVLKPLILSENDIKYTFTYNTLTNSKTVGIEFNDITSQVYKEYQERVELWNKQLDDYLTKLNIVPPTFPTKEDINKDPNAFKNYNNAIAVYGLKRQIEVTKFKKEHPSPNDQLQTQGNQLISKAKDEGRTTTAHKEEVIPEITRTPIKTQ